MYIYLSFLFVVEREFDMFFCLRVSYLQFDFPNRTRYLDLKIFAYVSFGVGDHFAVAAYIVGASCIFLWVVVGHFTIIHKQIEENF